MKKIVLAAIGAAFVALPAVTAASTVVPGQQDRYDSDNNGIPDAGKVVTGHYTDQYAYSDGTICNVVVGYRGDFGNTPYLDSGWITNEWRCKGPAGNQTYNYQIVSQEDPRYRGNPDWAIWGTWEIHVLTQGGQGNEAYGGNGNLVRPYTGS